MWAIWLAFALFALMGFDGLLGFVLGKQPKAPEYDVWRAGQVIKFLVCGFAAITLLVCPRP